MLDKVAYWHCLTAEGWSKEVVGSDGKTVYVVRWDRHSHKNRSVQMDYSCTCQAYKMKPGYCKHINQVKSQHCGWMQFISGGEPVEKNGEKVCPHCGDKVSTMLWGV